MEEEEDLSAAYAARGDTLFPPVLTLLLSFLFSLSCSVSFSLIVSLIFSLTL